MSRRDVNSLLHRDCLATPNSKAFFKEQFGLLSKQMADDLIILCCCWCNSSQQQQQHSIWWVARWLSALLWWMMSFPFFSSLTSNGLSDYSFNAIDWFGWPATPLWTWVLKTSKFLGPMGCFRMCDRRRYGPPSLNNSGVIRLSFHQATQITHSAPTTIGFPLHLLPLPTKARILCLDWLERILVA